MGYIQAFPLIVTSSVMVAGSVISLLTASWWPLVLLAIAGWILVALRAATNRIDSLLGWKDTGSGCGKTERSKPHESLGD